MKNASTLTKMVLAFSVILILYGALCRAVDLYFFWESRLIGRNVLFLGLILLFTDNLKHKKSISKNTTLEKLGIGFVSFFMLIQLAMYLVLVNTQAHKAALVHLKNNEQITQGLNSEIESILLKPIGSVEKGLKNNEDFGNATLRYLVKGHDKFMEITVFVELNSKTNDWYIKAIE